MRTIKNQKFVFSFFMLLLLCTKTIHSMTPQLNAYATKENIILGLATITSLYIVGKIVRYMYSPSSRNHSNNSNTIIEQCRTNYQKISSEIQTYQETYQSDSQLSDWDLRELISQNQDNHYPFITYHTIIMQELFKVKRYMAIMQHELKEISKQKELLEQYHSAEKTPLLESLSQLETQGKMLAVFVSKIHTILLILKYRVELFKEYTNDYYNWTYEQKHRNIDTIHSG
jgi:hypothetical protein